MIYENPRAEAERLVKAYLPFWKLVRRGSFVSKEARACLVRRLAHLLMHARLTRAQTLERAHLDEHYRASKLFFEQWAEECHREGWGLRLSKVAERSLRANLTTHFVQLAHETLNAYLASRVLPS